MSPLSSPSKNGIARSRSRRARSARCAAADAVNISGIQGIGVRLVEAALAYVVVTATDPRREGVPLLGRDEELALVDDLLARGRTSGATLLLYGEPGIGKSAIAAATVERARQAGCTVLTTTGVSSEAEIPYSCLHQLLWPVMQHADGLLAPQRTALDAALGSNGDALADPYRTGLAVLGILSDAAEQAPVALVAEDAHWLDAPTGEVLAFVSRRLEADRISMLITSRETVPRAIRGAGLPARRLMPLAADAAETLVNMLDPNLAAATRKRLLEAAGGNPLGLIELGAEAARAAGTQSPSWLPLTTRLERAFAARVGELTATVRSTLLVSALTDRADVAEILDATSLLTSGRVTLDAFSPAVQAGLVEVDDLRVRFSHPLVRSAIAHGGPADERQAAHRALAQVLSGDRSRAVWHRVAATTGTDGGLASELASMAQSALRRGAVVTAVQTLGRAARLTPDMRVRGARLLDAAELALEIGREDLVEALLADTIPLELTVKDVGRKAWLRETARRRAPDPAWFAAHLDRIEHLASDDDWARVSPALLTVAFRRWWSAVPAEVDARILKLARSLPPSASAVEGVVLSLVAPAASGAELRRWLERVEPDGLPAELLRLYAVSATIVSSFERAVLLADRAVELLRGRGRYGMLAPALVGRAWAGLFAGGWSASLAAADEAAIIARETEQPLWAVSATAAAAALRGVRGDLDEALNLAQRADADLVPGEADGMRALIELARGFAHLAADQANEAHMHLSRVMDVEQPWHADFVARWCAAEAAEAALRAGARDAGAAVLSRFDHVREPSAHLAASLARGRLLLAPDDEARLCGEEAVAAAAGSPALRARAQLTHGMRLRRARLADASRAELRAARDAFEALDMGPAAAHARRELRAAGEAVRSTVDAREALSPQELQIAHMAGEGLSNREIGQALYLSHRTIGSHLYRIFPKLGIASRAELRTALGGEAASTS